MNKNDVSLICESFPGAQYLIEKETLGMKKCPVHGDEERRNPRSFGGEKMV